MTESLSPTQLPKRNLRRACSLKPTRWSSVLNDGYDFIQDLLQWSRQMRRSSCWTASPAFINLAWTSSFMWYYCFAILFYLDFLDQSILYYKIIFDSWEAVKRMSFFWCRSLTASSMQSPRSSGRTLTRRRYLTTWRWPCKLSSEVNHSPQVIMLALDEMIDGGMIMECDPQQVFSFRFPVLEVAFGWF